MIFRPSLYLVFFFLGSLIRRINISLVFLSCLALEQLSPLTPMIENNPVLRNCRLFEFSVPLSSDLLPGNRNRSLLLKYFKYRKATRHAHQVQIFRNLFWYLGFAIIEVDSPKCINWVNSDCQSIGHFQLKNQFRRHQSIGISEGRICKGWINDYC